MQVDLKGLYVVEYHQAVPICYTHVPAATFSPALYILVIVLLGEQKLLKL